MTLMPVRWGANQSWDAGRGRSRCHGSLGRSYGSKRKLGFAERCVALRPRQGGRSCQRLCRRRLPKQVVNRLLEPFSHISVVVTATEWDNFFALRCHPDADPTMRALAEAMRDAIRRASLHGRLEIGICPMSRKMIVNPSGSIETRRSSGFSP